MIGETLATHASRKILIVDDDAEWRDCLKLVLQELGYHTAEAASGEEALASLSEAECSVILLDLRMPGMNGEEVVKHLPRNHPQVVFMTAAQAEDASAALRQGAHYYFPKDASLEKLALLLQSLGA
jgi:CheY-like chemotaxis protein